jgi:hypothetical protein
MNYLQVVQVFSSIPGGQYWIGVNSAGVHTNHQSTNQKKKGFSYAANWSESHGCTLMDWVAQVRKHAPYFWSSLCFDLRLVLVTNHYQMNF